MTKMGKPTASELSEAAAQLSSQMARYGWDKRPEWYAVNRVMRDADEEAEAERKMAARRGDQP